ncbi:MAG: thermonuclease family protein [Proteobacteria bacterium]|nr:thermonuclease family protein [Pseudomonadota bacterium]
MGMRCFAILLALVMPLAAHAAVPASGRVAKVIDGDTVVLASGEHVRLLDINTPEIGHDDEPDEPGARAASVALRNMALGKDVKLVYGPQEYDQYGRLLAHLYLQDGSWVNGELVAQGLAHIYTFGDNELKTAQLLPLEEKARAEKKGLWALPQWRVFDAASCCGDGEIGRYILVKGKPLAVVVKKDETYFNFGPDFRTDFTVEVEKKDMRWFKKAGIKDLAAYYGGKELLVRGKTAPVNGVLMRVTHPAQIEIVE